MNESSPQTTRASVAFFHVSAILGGAERSFLDLVGLPVTVTSINLPEDGPLADKIRATEWADALRFLPFPERLLRLSREDGLKNLWRLPTALSAILAYLGECRKRLARERPAVAYSHGIKNHFLLTLAARSLGIALVWHLQDFWPRHPLARLFFRWAIRGRLTVICNSEAVRADLDPRGRHRDKVRTIHNAIEPAAYPFHPRGGSARIAGFVGMLVPWKGPHLVLEAARILGKDTAAPLQFWIVGDVPYRTNAALSRYSQELRAGAPENVRFLGMITEPRGLYAEIDLLCHASLAPEPFGRIVLEGMASGAIVIAANAGGPREVIEDGTDGFLYTPGDARALAAAIARARTLTPEASRALRARARAKIESRFSASAYRAAVAACIAGAADGTRRP